ncbi:hypothetical protein Pelo_15707 [Pelomyxa schiedti]|nr:hypothetical protein Pelo_15707 [Pelomyxa schiedti]
MESRWQTISSSQPTHQRCPPKHQQDVCVHTSTRVSAQSQALALSLASSPPPPRARVAVCFDNAKTASTPGSGEYNLAVVGLISPTLGVIEPLWATYARWMEDWVEISGGTREVVVRKLDGTTDVGLRLIFSGRGHVMWVKLMTEVEVGTGVEAGGGRVGASGKKKEDELVVLLDTFYPLTDVEERAIAVVDLEESWKASTATCWGSLLAVVVRSYSVPVKSHYTSPTRAIPIPGQYDFLVQLELTDPPSIFSVKSGREV